MLKHNIGRIYNKQCEICRQSIKGPNHKCLFKNIIATENEELMKQLKSKNIKWNDAMKIVKKAIKEHKHIQLYGPTGVGKSH